MPGVSVSLVFDEDKDEIAVETQMNASKPAKPKAKIRRLIQSKHHSICTHTDPTPDPSSAGSEAEDYNCHNYEKEK